MARDDLRLSIRVALDFSPSMTLSKSCTRLSASTKTPGDHKKNEGDVRCFVTGIASSLILDSTSGTCHLNFPTTWSAGLLTNWVCSVTRSIVPERHTNTYKTANPYHYGGSLFFLGRVTVNPSTQRRPCPAQATNSKHIKTKFCVKRQVCFKAADA